MGEFLLTVPQVISLRELLVSAKQSCHHVPAKSGFSVPSLNHTGTVGEPNMHQTSQEAYCKRKKFTARSLCPEGNLCVYSATETPWMSFCVPVLRTRQKTACKELSLVLAPTAHRLKREQYREDQRGPGRRMTPKAWWTEGPEFARAQRCGPALPLPTL